MLFRNKKPNDYHEGKWNGLGGKVDSGESPDECAIREIKEESGLDVYDPKFHGIITFPNFDQKNDWLVFIYSFKNFSGEIIDSPEGQLEWINDNKLLDLNLWEGDKIFLPWLTQNKFFEAKFNYDNGKLVSHTVKFY